jgi:hypothetical protein
MVGLGRRSGPHQEIAARVVAGVVAKQDLGQRGEDFRRQLGTAVKESFQRID